MSTSLKTVVLSGSTSSTSRTLVLAQALLARVGQSLTISPQVITLGDLARDTGAAFSRDELPAGAARLLADLEAADLLIIAAPVFRGGLPGQLKHVLDLVDQHAFINTPVLLAATGGSDRHSLVIDHQLRPLFAFFQALTLPVGVFAGPDDIQGAEISSPALQERIDLAVALAVRWFPAYLRAQAETPRKVA